jgi:hypothetical protein
MKRLKCSFREIAVVSAAICWFFSAVQPTLASTLIMISSPTLTADPTSLYPGNSIEISGSSFSQCERHATGPNVVVYWDGTDWTKATAFHSGFSVNATVPSDAPAGSHEVTAACYDPAATVSSLPLASAEVQVLPGPALQLSSSEAAAGSSVTAAGTGFGQCPGKGLGDDVQLLWDAAPLGGPVGLDGNGAFSQGVIIPAAAAGTGHTVAAECYDPAIGSVTSGVLASQHFTVTPPPSTSAPASKAPTTPVTSSVGTPTGTVATPTNSPAVVSGPSPTASPGRWSPVTLAAGVGGGLAAVLVLLAGLLAMHARARLRNRLWVQKHLRTVAQPLDTVPPNVRIHRRPGAAPLSVGLEPRPDRLGDQQVKEISP